MKTARYGLIDGMQSYSLIPGFKITVIFSVYYRRTYIDFTPNQPTHKPCNQVNFSISEYAMYNGGPDQFDKFLKRKKDGTFYSSDNLYFEKYSWVKNDQWENINKCLIGG